MENKNKSFSPYLWDFLFIFATLYFGIAIITFEINFSKWNYYWQLLFIVLTSVFGIVVFKTYEEDVKD